MATRTKNNTGKRRVTKRAAEKPVDSSRAGAKLADTILESIEKSIEQMPEDARHAAVEGLLARLTELAPGEAAPKPPSPWQLTGAAFDGGTELREDATPADLFALMFYYSDTDDADILTAAVKSAADDLEIIAAALASGHDIADPLQGFLQRQEWMLRVAREVHRRIHAAAGGAS